VQREFYTGGSGGTLARVIIWRRPDTPKAEHHIARREVPERRRAPDADYPLREREHAEAMAALNLHWVNGYFVALALAVGIAIRFTVQQKFGTTPTDYLIVIGVVAVAFVNRMDRLDMQSGAAVHFITYVIGLFYSCELIFGQIRNWRLALVWPAMLTLLVLAGRGFLAGA
jgi:hypothetical protein